MLRLVLGEPEPTRGYDTRRQNDERPAERRLLPGVGYGHSWI